MLETNFVYLCLSMFIFLSTLVFPIVSTCFHRELENIWLWFIQSIPKWSKPLETLQIPPIITNRRYQGSVQRLTVKLSKRNPLRLHGMTASCIAMSLSTGSRPTQDDKVIIYHNIPNISESVLFMCEICAGECWWTLYYDLLCVKYALFTYEFCVLECFYMFFMIFLCEMPSTK